MNRRSLLKALVAAPIMAAIPSTERIVGFDPGFAGGDRAVASWAILRDRRIVFLEMGARIRLDEVLCHPLDSTKRVTSTYGETVVTEIEAVPVINPSSSAPSEAWPCLTAHKDVPFPLLDQIEIIRA